MPDGRASLYEILALSAVNEANLGIARAHGQDSGRTLRIAKWAAAASILTGRSVLTSDVIPTSDPRLSFDALRSGEMLHGLSGPANAQDLMQSHLMVPAAGGYRFADRTLAEYLAAAFLDELLRASGGEDSLWRTLLTLDVAGETFVAPQLRGVAAWLGELNAEAFDVILRSEPSVLLENDFAAHHPGGSEQLFWRVLDDDALLRTASYSRQVLAWSYVNADGGNELRRRIASGQPSEVRRRAFEFIRGARLRDFDAEVVAVLQDPDEDEIIRYWASACLDSGVSAEHLMTLKQATLSRRLADDQDHRVLGNVLSILWPHQLGGDEIFAALVPPTSHGILEYEGFLVTSLIRKMNPADLPRAAQWLASAISSDEWERFHAGGLLEQQAEAFEAALTDEQQAGDRAELIVALAELLGPASEERFDLAGAVRDSLSLGDLKRLASRLVELADAHRAPPSWTIKSLIESRPIEMVSEFAEWCFETAVAVDERELEWVQVVDAVVDPTRDRALVDRMLDLPEPERRRFGRLVDPVEIASVPEFVRRRRRRIDKPLEPEPEGFSERVAVLLSQSDTWLRVVIDALQEHHAMVPIAETELLASLPSEHISDLLLYAEQFCKEYIQPSEADLAPSSVSASELAYSHALHLLFNEGLVPPDDPQFNRNQRTIVRCQGFMLSEGYDEVLRLAHASNPADYELLCASSIARMAAGQSPVRFEKLRRYPGGPTRSLVQAAVSLLALGAGAPDDRARALGELLAIDVAAVRSNIDVLLLSFDGSELFGDAAAMMLACGIPLEELSRATEEPSNLRQFVTAVASRYRFGSDPGAVKLGQLANDDLLSLYRWATDAFDRFSMPRDGVGFGHDVEWNVDGLRSACLKELATRGRKGVELLRDLAVGHSLVELLGTDTLRVLVDDWWEPFELGQLAQLLSDARATIVRSPDELLQTMRQALRAYQESLRGIGGGAELLWSSNVPRQETDLSIDLMRFLRVYFDRSNVVLNREVELRPASDVEDVRGERSDILVQAAHSERPPITLVIEIKGSWHTEKYTGYERQLVGRYLTHPDVGAGLHVVFWFPRVSWEPSDGRRSKSPASRSRVERELAAKKPTAAKPLDHAVVDVSR